MTTRKPLSSPSWSATRLAANRSWPNTSLCLASALLSCVKPSLRLGMRTTWTGACGLMSRNANTDSSSYTTVAGISLLTILSNNVGAPVSSVTAAAAAVLAAASSSPLRAFTAVVLLLLHSLFEPIAVPAAARRRCPLLAFCKPKTDLQPRAAAIPLLQHGTIPAACAVRPSSAHLAMRDGWWYVLGWWWYVGTLSLSLSRKTRDHYVNCTNLHSSSSCKIGFQLLYTHMLRIRNHLQLVKWWKRSHENREQRQKPRGGGGGRRRTERVRAWEASRIIWSGRTCSFNTVYKIRTIYIPAHKRKQIYILNFTTKN